MSYAPPADVTQRFSQVERDLRIGQLLKEADAAKSPPEAHRILLTVAGYQVGKGDWQAAKDIYEKLIADSPDPDVLHAVARNLHVTRQNLAIAEEADAGKREWMQLDLADVHENYGHHQAAKRIWKQLASTAAEEAVREKAARSLAAPQKPTELPIPAAMKGK